MQENEFEKQVQKQMEEFRLRPSATVWEKVEEEIKKKKKRRVVFYLFLLAGLSLLGYSGYFIIHQTNQTSADINSTLSKNTAAVKENNVQTTTGGTTPAGQQQPLRQNLPVINKVETSRDATADLPVKEQKGVISKAKPGETLPALEQEHIQARAGKPLKVAAPATTKPAIAGISKKLQKQLPGKKQEQTTEPGQMAALYPNDNNEIGDEKVLVTLPPLAGGDLQEMASIGIKEEDIVLNKASVIEPTDLVSKVPVTAVKSKNGSKINWGIDFSAGISNSRKKAFLFSDSQKSMDVLFSSPGGGGGSPGYLPPLKPSDPRPGLAFRIGPVAELKLSKRSSVSAGLQYAYMSNKIQVGTYTNSTVVVNNTASQSLRVEAFYRGIQREDFTNHYHFIQLPLLFNLQLNKSSRLPVLWGIGASAGYLLASNGLAYDTTAGGIYYRDGDIFNKFHFNLNTGFSLRFGNAKKMQWSIGPELSMSMNKLMKDAYGRKQYMLYGGLTGRLLFSKKK